MITLEMPEGSIRKTILVVDDDAPIRLLISHILTRAGYNVLIACDGMDGERRLREADEVNLLLTDISMPGMNGFGLMRIARTMFPEMPVIFISGDLDFSLPTRDGICFLQKPFSKDDVLDLVARALFAPSPSIGAELTAIA